MGTLDSHVIARGVRLAPADGISTTFDADLEVTYDAKAQDARGRALPHVTGDVTHRTRSTTPGPSRSRPTSGRSATRAKRTEVDTYDPSLDVVAFDVHVRSRTPLVIKNNLVEVQLAIDSGTLEVTGTNQRIGLRGALKALPGGRFHFQSNDFDVRQGLIRFDDPTRIAPNVDVTAVTEYRRYTDTSAGAAAGRGHGRRVRRRVDRLDARRLALAHHAARLRRRRQPAGRHDERADAVAGGHRAAAHRRDDARRARPAPGEQHRREHRAQLPRRGERRRPRVKQALPVIDDFRFGSAYSTVTGKTEPQLTVGKRLTNDVRASVTAGLSEDRELRSNIEWRLNNRLSVQGSYDNINDVSSSTLGNLGVDLRWRLEFE